MPEFDGKVESYVSWRQAARTAYKVFQKYDGSSKHYQALAIIRNKVRGPADAVLSSFNTPLNFEAIISRLDFNYADKQPLHVVEQQMSTLRQGNSSVIEFYDIVERKLTLLINKTLMTYDKQVATVLNEKHRADAMRTFISGLKKPLCDMLFAARPRDLPNALALAQEVETNHDRYRFAAMFASKNEEQQNRNPLTNRDKYREYNATAKNPYFKKEPNNNREQHTPMEIDPTSSKYRQQTNHRNYSKQSVEPMSVDPSTSKFNQGKFTPNTFKRNANSDRFTGPKLQRVNHIHDTKSEENYNDMAAEAEEELAQETTYADQVNFLTDGPGYRS